jgi:hypothetical protein
VDPSPLKMAGDENSSHYGALVQERGPFINNQNVLCGIAARDGVISARRS